MQLLKTLTTKLETADRESISLILDDKAMTLGANQTADYIGFALENIESSISRIDSAIKELQAIKKDAIAQSELIKASVSEWLTDNGIDKLNGDRISSISVFNKADTKELIIDDEEAVINAGYFKMTVDKSSAKEALLNGIMVYGCHIEITHNDDSIRLNKKRIKNDKIDSIE